MNKSSQNFFSWKQITTIAFAVIFLILLPPRAHSQLTKPGDKIDIFFKTLIAQQKQEQGSSKKKTFPCFRKKAAKSSSPVKKFECIVYTKDAQLLRDKNITINSVLPSFVTAVATLKEIEMMSLLSSVSFIEAPQINMIH